MKALKINENGGIYSSLLSDFFETDKFFNKPWFDKELGHSLPVVNIK